MIYKKIVVTTLLCIFSIALSHKAMAGGYQRDFTIDEGIAASDAEALSYLLEAGMGYDTKVSENPSAAIAKAWDWVTDDPNNDPPTQKSLSLQINVSAGDATAKVGGIGNWNARSVSAALSQCTGGFVGVDYDHYDVIKVVEAFNDGLQELTVFEPGGPRTKLVFAQIAGDRIEASVEARAFNIVEVDTRGFSAKAEVGASHAEITSLNLR